MLATWQVHPANPRRAHALADAARVHPFTAQCLLNRGLATAAEVKRFFHPSLSSLGNPNGLPDLDRAVARIQAAVSRGESVLIFGDSDVDGLTASVILHEVLRSLGASVRAVPSNRIEDGYGLPESLVDELCNSSIALLIMVDCGTNQPEAVRRLEAHGIDTIIVDHHLPLEAGARPHALVNPHRSHQAPYQELCSAGLALKLAQALLGDGADERLAEYLDLAALGTLADYSPLIGDNRVIVSEGLPRIVQSARLGLRRLCEDTQTREPSADQIIKRLVPRLNASGRLGDATSVWRVLCREHPDQHEAWAAQAEAAHKSTKQLQRQIIAQAQEQVNRLHFKDQYVLVVSRTGWHQGLMGPLAAQLAQQHGRPAIAIAMDEEQGTGSGRSVPSLNLLEALKGCQEVLVRFGGHAQACGLTVNRRQLETFRMLVNQQAKTLLGDAGLAQPRWVDLELPLKAVELGWVEELERFAPFGQGNPRPTVLIRGVTIEAKSPRSAMLSDKHSRLPATGTLPQAAAGEHYDVIASPMGLTRQLRLALRDVKVSAGPSARGPHAGTRYTP